MAFGPVLLRYSAGAEVRRLGSAVLGDALAHQHRQARLGVILAVHAETNLADLPRLGILDRGLSGRALVGVLGIAERAAVANDVGFFWTLTRLPLIFGLAVNLPRIAC